MASKFCLVADVADKFLESIRSGKLDIDKLSSASSEERRAFFTEMMGERNAKEVNALFESKLLLNNRKLGLVNWAKQITGIKPQVRNDLIAKIERMSTDKLSVGRLKATYKEVFGNLPKDVSNDELLAKLYKEGLTKDELMKSGVITNILSPENEKAFLQDLASKRLGTGISIDEANKITALSEKVKSLANFTNEGERIAYGRSQMALTDYVNSLNPERANLATNILNLPRSIMASLDLSAPLNQGWGMLSRKQFYTNLWDMIKVARSEEAYKNLQADILTRVNYKGAKKAGLRLTDLGTNLQQREEQFMSTFIDKIPGMKGSERAYTGFLNKLRMDVYDDLVKKATLAGEDVGVGSKVLEDIANVVNNFTGGGSPNVLFGLKDSATPAMSAFFFSPRKIASTLQMINPVNYFNPNISKTARMAAMRNLIGSLSMTFGVIKLADMLGGDLVETDFDPRSSDFGKIRVGDTRLDMSGGNAGYITLISRIINGNTKDPNTGALTPLGTKPGQSSAFELLTRFGRNKLSPNMSFLIDALSRENAIGQKVSVGEAALNRITPMYAASLVELLQSDTSGKVALALTSLIGAGMNTYSIGENWEDKDTKEITQFTEKVGAEDAKTANEKYNKRIKEEINALRITPEYKALDNEEKLKKIKKIKDTAKKEVFAEYGFKYKALPTNN